MEREKFIYSIYPLDSSYEVKLGVKPVKELEFESDNVYKDAAQMLLAEDPTQFKYGIVMALRTKDEPVYFTVGYIMPDGVKYKSIQNKPFISCKNTFIKFLNTKGFGDRYLPDDMSELSAYLVAANAGSNKYLEYRLQGVRESGTTYITATWGRAGENLEQNSTRRTTSYNPSDFWFKYFERIAAGYEDKSDIFPKNEVVNKDGEPIGTVSEEPKTDEAVKEFIAAQHRKVQNNFDFKNFTFSAETYEKAQKALHDLYREAAYINQIQKRMPCSDEQLLLLRAARAHFEQQYEKLLRTIPRILPSIKKYISEVSFDERDRGKDFFISERLTAEQDLLNALNFEKRCDVGDNKQDILKKSGIDIITSDFEMKFDIIDDLQSGEVRCGHNVENVFSFENAKIRAKFHNTVQKMGIQPSQIRLLYHGTRTENIWSIMNTGLLLNPDAVINGKMFGQGIYFAPEGDKARGYTDMAGSYWANGKDNRGYMLGCRVAVGNPYYPTHSLSSYFSFSDLPKGTQSVVAEKKKTGLRRDEIIVYNEGQVDFSCIVQLCAREQFSIDTRKHRHDVLANVVYDASTECITANIMPSEKGKPSYDAVQMSYSISEKKFLPVTSKNGLNETDLAFFRDVFMNCFADNEREFEAAMQLVQKERSIELFESRGRIFPKKDKLCGMLVTKPPEIETI